MMNKDNLKNTIFGVGLAVILLLGLTLTFSPVGGGLRNRLLEMVNTPGNLFHYVAGLFRGGEDEEESPVELTEDPAAAENGAENANDETQPQQLPIIQSQNPDETPLLQFEDKELDTEYTSTKPDDNTNGEEKQGN